MQCLVTELAITGIYHDMPTYLEVLDEFTKHQFTVSGFYPVSRNKSDLTLIELDCVLIKQ